VKNIRVALALWILAFFGIIENARAAKVEIDVDLKHHFLNVTGDGKDILKGVPIASGTGVGEHITPRGTFRPLTVEPQAYTKAYKAMMPLAIFFERTHNNAIHGTYDLHSLRHDSTHGCVRVPMWAAAKMDQVVLANSTVYSYRIMYDKRHPGTVNVVRRTDVVIKIFG
jgi:lipoprotein-anchoring transpeptidase ErfK/SrfK